MLDTGRYSQGLRCSKAHADYVDPHAWTVRLGKGRLRDHVHMRVWSRALFRAALLALLPP